MKAKVVQIKTAGKMIIIIIKIIIIGKMKSKRILNNEMVEITIMMKMIEIAILIAIEIIKIIIMMTMVIWINLIRNFNRKNQILIIIRKKIKILKNN